ncbi:11697_t:CDS:2, partial [Funneliformis geosporum]
MSQNHMSINVNDFVSDLHQNSISTLPHNDKPISKVAISPQSKYLLTYSQEDESFVGWLVNTCTDPFNLSLDTDIMPYKCEGIKNFKVSDYKIILYDNTDEGLAKFHDLKNNNEIEIKDKYIHTNFLEDGNIVTFQSNSSALINPAVLIYEYTKKKKLARKAFYLFNEKDIRFGGFKSDRIWMMSYGLIFLLDLTTFQLQKLSLFEKNLNIEQVKFKFSKKFIIMKVVDKYYVYSNNIDHINFPIGNIKDLSDLNYQEFEFAGNNNEFMITLSYNKTINIYFWKSNLKGSISCNKLVEIEVLEKSIHIEFKDKCIFIVSPDKPYIYNIANHDWRKSIFDDNMGNIYIDQKYISIQDKMNDDDVVYLKDETIRKTLHDVIFKYYDKCELDMTCIADPSEEESKMPLINNLLNTKYYFVLYGEKLLKSAIKQNNIHLISTIFNKTIENFKENPKSNFCILSIAGNNILYLKDKYYEYVLKYYDETTLILDPLNQEISYIKVDHHHSICKQLEIIRPYIPYHYEEIKFWKIPIFIVIAKTLIRIEPTLGNLADPNNPWNLTDKYYQVDRDGNIINNMTIYKIPDEYTNLFSNYSNSLLAMSIFLTGDGSLFNKWSPQENKTMITLMLLYSFIIVIFLMNLLIGLLNMAIEEDNDRATYMAQKAE